MCDSRNTPNSQMLGGNLAGRPVVKIGGPHFDSAAGAFPPLYKSVSLGAGITPVIFEPLTLSQIRNARGTQKYLWVLTTNGDVRIYKRYDTYRMPDGKIVKRKIDHPDIAGSRLALGGGEVVFKNGTMVAINNYTGHFLVIGNENQKAMVHKAFKAEGFSEVVGKYKRVHFGAGIGARSVPTLYNVPNIKPAAFLQQIPVKKSFLQNKRITHRTLLNFNASSKALSLPLKGAFPHIGPFGDLLLGIAQEKYAGNEHYIRDGIINYAAYFLPYAALGRVHWSIPLIVGVPHLIGDVKIMRDETYPIIKKYTKFQKEDDALYFMTLQAGAILLTLFGTLQDFTRPAYDLCENIGEGTARKIKNFFGITKETSLEDRHNFIIFLSQCAVIMRNSDRSPDLEIDATPVPNNLMQQYQVAFTSYISDTQAFCDAYEGVPPLVEYADLSHSSVLGHDSAPHPETISQSALQENTGDSKPHSVSVIDNSQTTSFQLPTWHIPSKEERSHYNTTTPTVMPDFTLTPAYIRNSTQTDYIQEEIEKNRNKENQDPAVTQASGDRFFYHGDSAPQNSNKTPGFIEGLAIKPDSIGVQYGGRNTVVVGCQLNNGVGISTQFKLDEAGYAAQFNFTIPFSSEGGSPFTSDKAPNQDTFDIAAWIENIYKQYLAKKAKRDAEHVKKHVENSQETLHDLAQYLQEQLPVASADTYLVPVSQATYQSVNKKFDEAKEELAHAMRRATDHSHHHHAYESVNQLGDASESVSQNQLNFQHDESKKQTLQQHSSEVTRDNAGLSVECLIDKYLAINNTFLSQENIIAKGVLHNLITEKIIQEKRFDLVDKYPFLKEWNIGAHLELPPIAIPSAPLRYGQIRAHKHRGKIGKTAFEKMEKIKEIYEDLRKLVAANFNPGDTQYLDKITKCYNKIIRKCAAFEEDFGTRRTRGDDEFPTVYSHYKSPIDDMLSKSTGLCVALKSGQVPDADYLSPYIPQQKNNQTKLEIECDKYLTDIKNTFIDANKETLTARLIELAKEFKQKKSSGTFTLEDAAKADALDYLMVLRAFQMTEDLDSDNAKHLLRHAVGDLSATYGESLGHLEAVWSAQTLDLLRNNYTNASKAMPTETLLKLANEFKQKKIDGLLTAEDAARIEALDFVINDRACQAIFTGDLENGKKLFESSVHGLDKYRETLINLFAQMKSSIPMIEAMIGIQFSNMEMLVKAETNLTALGSFFDSHFTADDLAQKPELMAWDTEFRQLKAAVGFVKDTVLTTSPTQIPYFWLQQIKESNAVPETDPQYRFHGLLSTAGETYIKSKIQELFLQREFYPAFNMLTAYIGIQTEAAQVEAQNTLALFKRFEQNLQDNVGLDIWTKELEILLARDDKQSFSYTSGYDFIKNSILLSAINTDLLSNDLTSATDKVNKIMGTADEDLQTLLKGYLVVIEQGRLNSAITQEAMFLGLNATMAKISELIAEKGNEQQLAQLYAQKNQQIGQIIHDIEKTKSKLGFHKEAADDYLKLSIIDSAFLPDYRRSMFHHNGQVIDLFARPLLDGLHEIVQEFAPSCLKTPEKYFFEAVNVAEIFVPNASTLAVQAIKADAANNFFEMGLVSDAMAEAYDKLQKDLANPFQWAYEHLTFKEISAELSRDGSLMLARAFLKVIDGMLGFLPERYQESMKETLNYAQLILRFENYFNALTKAAEQFQTGKFAANFPSLIATVLRSLTDLGFYCLHAFKAREGEDIENADFYKFENALGTFMDWAAKMVMLMRGSFHPVVVGAASVLALIHIAYKAYFSGEASKNALGALIKNYYFQHRLGNPDTLKATMKIPATLSSFGLKLKYNAKQASNSPENVVRILHLKLLAQRYYNSKDFPAFLHLTRIRSSRMSQEHQLPLKFVWQIAINRLRVYAETENNLIKFRKLYQRYSTPICLGHFRDGDENWDMIKNELENIVKDAFLKCLKAAEELFNEEEINEEKIKTYLSNITKEYDYCAEWWNLIEDPKVILGIAYCYFCIFDDEHAKRFLARLSSTDWEHLLTDEKNQDCVQPARDMFAEFDIDDFTNQAIKFLFEKLDRKEKAHKGTDTTELEICGLLELKKADQQNKVVYLHRFFNPPRSTEAVIEDRFQHQYEQMSRVEEPVIADDIAALTSRVMTYVKANEQPFKANHTVPTLFQNTTKQDGTNASVLAGDVPKLVGF